MEAQSPYRTKITPNDFAGTVVARRVHSVSVNNAANATRYAAVFDGTALLFVKNMAALTQFTKTWHGGRPVLDQSTGITVVISDTYNGNPAPESTHTVDITYS